MCLHRCTAVVRLTLALAKLSCSLQFRSEAPQNSKIHIMHLRYFDPTRLAGRPDPCPSMDSIVLSYLLLHVDAYVNTAGLSTRRSTVGDRTFPVAAARAWCHGCSRSVFNVWRHLNNIHIYITFYYITVLGSFHKVSCMTRGQK